MTRVWQKKSDAPTELYGTYPHLSPLIIQMLYNRQITEPSTVERFFNHTYEDSHDPFLFRDMQKTVDRIWKAMDGNEKVVIYGDYDADAVTACAVLIRAFNYLNFKVSYYIPDRFSEGYGLNIPAFQKLKDEGTSLVITVDCGINSRDVADFCNQNGMDLLITDHHELTGDEPKAYAIVNPKNPGDVYPEHQITGVGVAYKLVQALFSNLDKVKEFNPNFKAGYEKWLLDLVSIGTIADCHSLIGENRIFVSRGLLVLNKTRWPGLRALLSKIRVLEELNAETVGFQLAPRINAAGRLVHASLALELLITDDQDEAIRLAKELDETNTRRKDLTARILSEAREQAELSKEYAVLVLAHEHWHKGLVGIVAGKLCEEFARPVVVLEKGEQEATGSVRSYGNFNTVAALRSAEDVLSRFGGHKEAAGLTLPSSKIRDLQNRLQEYANNNSEEFSSQEPILQIESELSERDLNLNTYEQVKRFEPFGSHNPKPVFTIRARVQTLRPVGKDASHIQMKLGLGKANAEAIGFKFGWVVNKLNIGDEVNLAVELTKDSWNGLSKLKLRIVDIQI